MVVDFDTFISNHKRTYPHSKIEDKTFESYRSPETKRLIRLFRIQVPSDFHLSFSNEWIWIAHSSFRISVHFHKNRIQPRKFHLGESGREGKNERANNFWHDMLSVSNWMESTIFSISSLPTLLSSAWHPKSERKIYVNIEDWHSAYVILLYYSRANDVQKKKLELFSCEIN